MECNYKFTFGEVIILEQIIEYIKRNYNPISIILYGSYADGTNNLNSDFTYTEPSPKIKSRN